MARHVVRHLFFLHHLGRSERYGKGEWLGMEHSLSPSYATRDVSEPHGVLGREGALCLAVSP